MLALAGKDLTASDVTSLDLTQFHLPLNFIRLTSTRQLIGNIRLKPIDKVEEPSKDQKDLVPSVYELGYFLEKQYQSKGVLTAALELLIQHTKANYKNVKVVRARIWKMNEKSTAVCQRVGFEKVGEETTTWPEIKGGGERELDVWELKMV